MPEPDIPKPSTDVDLSMQLNAQTNTRNELIDDAIYTLAGEVGKPVITDGVLYLSIPAGGNEQVTVTIEPKVDMVIPSIITKASNPMLIKWYRGTGTDKVPLKSFYTPYPFYAPIILKAGNKYTLIVAERDNSVDNYIIAPAIIVGTYPADGVLATIS
jgi:hypothetical protein